jgi:chemotaxis protein MotB
MARSSIVCVSVASLLPAACVSQQTSPHQTTKINVNGYTDTTPIGSGLMKEGVTSNLILSQKRAESVTQYLIAQGVNPAMVSSRGFGDADPITSNDTPAGRAQNRRVELTLATPGQ